MDAQSCLPGPQIGFFLLGIVKEPIYTPAMLQNLDELEVRIHLYVDNLMIRYSSVCGTILAISF
jgi:hypothetical protein